MPLLDLFRPPLSQRRHWDSFHGAWAEAIALHLNQTLLPERYFAEARVKLGCQTTIGGAERSHVTPSKEASSSHQLNGWHRAKKACGGLT